MNWSFSVSSCNKRLLQKRIVCLNLVRIWYIFSHSHVCVKSRKRASIFFFFFWGGGGGGGGGGVGGGGWVGERL